MKQLYLHIGTHKTGTTTIQRNLENVESDLKKEKIIYLNTPSIFEEMSDLKTVDEDMIIKCREYLNSNTKKYSEDYKFVMSSEHFSGSVEHGHYKATAKMLRQITEGFDVTIIVYLRRQDLFVESLYTQSIHEGGYLSFDQFLNEFDFSDFDWYALLSSYTKVFERESIIVNVYDKKHLLQKSIMQSFAESIGSNFLKNKVFKNTKYNVSYDRNILEIARISNPVLDVNQKKRLRRILHAVSAMINGKKYTFFNEKSRNEFISKYDKSNALVAKEYVRDGSEKLFSDDKTSNNSYEGLSLEKSVQVLTLALLSEPVTGHNDLVTLKLVRKIEEAIRNTKYLKNIFKLLRSKLNF